MAVARAQHAVRDLTNELTSRGVKARYAIHPVAGRLPGHMNVLLAEAYIPYTDLVEMDDINHDMPQADVALVVGANDVVNPAAHTDKSSPIYGMPILNADKARNVIVIKRGQGTGFSGIENALFYLDQTRMLYGDGQAKADEVASAANDGDPSRLVERVCDADFYVAEADLIRGDAAAAKPLFQRAADKCPFASFERMGATAELEQMK